MLFQYPPTQPGAATGNAAAGIATAQLACAQPIVPRANGATAAAVDIPEGVGAAAGGTSAAEAAAVGNAGVWSAAAAARGNEAGAAMGGSGGNGGGPMLSVGVWSAGGNAPLAVAATPAQVSTSHPAGGRRLPSRAAAIPPALHTQHKRQTAQQPLHSHHQVQPLLGPVLHRGPQRLAQSHSTSQPASKGTAAASFWRPNPLLSCMGAPPYALLPATFPPVLAPHLSALN